MGTQQQKEKERKEKEKKMKQQKMGAPRRTGGLGNVAVQWLGK
jgi:hypothetical protein